MNTRILFYAFLLLVMTSLADAAQAQTFNVLYRFTGAKGDAGPDSNLIIVDGMLYGTTDGCCCEQCYGSVFSLFSLSGSGQENVLYSFTGGRDGGEPEAGMILGTDGVLYGTTGTNVFSVTLNGHERVLHIFDGNEFPQAALVEDAQNNLYGTTMQGASFGVVYKVSACGAETLVCPETVLYAFTGSGDIDGAYPVAPLILDKAGNLYGTTSQGGFTNCMVLGNQTGCGTVFKVSPKGKETVLYRFTGGTDGATPRSGLISDMHGNLYGTTSLGGTYNQGTIFKLDPAGNETILHTFEDLDGAEPTAGLIRDNAGNFYGTTSGGGLYGGGAIFKLDSNGMETVLYSLNGTTDGSYVRAGLVRDAKGDLYGTAHFGGAQDGGYGTVFELIP